MKNFLYLLLALLIFACSSNDSSDNETEQTIILTLDNISSNTITNDVWTEQNIDLSFVSGTADDCGTGRSVFGVETTFVWLYPSRLSIDLSSLKSIQKVEIDINDFCNTNCTQAFLIDGSGMILSNTGNTLIQSLETLIIENPSEGFISELAISSCEGQIHEVRVYQN
ncbi:hypothetical protein [uncultured Polaribacter sp.]|jgi:hypothetical protein|uniref:hypothetical protein n=1 Tax=uncultured Polaribacter sp. TaxID=174711 RepID=UPI0032B2A356|tara:strand:+ start:117 stop:620 length:504 start_codon:yes stop_codon:yes gene_type:complete